MKWIVFGHQGWIGTELARILEEQGEDVVKTMVRADNVIEVEALLLLERPERVVMTIGRTHGPGCNTIDYLESKDKLRENIRDNLFGPWVVAHLCQRYGIHCTYLGTGCIFTYDKDHTRGSHDVFGEESLPNFFGSQYSIVKGFTDQMMHVYPDSTLNARIRMPIVDHPHPRNFITKLTGYSHICSIPNSMTVLPELLPVLIDMAKRRVTGTVNLVNPGVISHNEVLEMYKQVVDPSFTWLNFSQEEQAKILKAERSNNYLDTTRLESMYPNIDDIHTAMYKCLVLYHENLTSTA